MFGPRLTGGFSFGRMLGGIGKTLNVINEVIPLYKEAKPLVTNARNAISLLKEFSNTSTKRIMDNTQKNTAFIKEKINNNKEVSDNKKGLTFFQ